MAPPDVSAGARRLTRHAGPLALLLFGVASLPYAYGFWTSPPDKVFTGLMFDVPDHAQYWSWVTASQASFFISNTMTPEPNPAIFINPMMWLLAQVQLLLNLSFPVLLQFWRLLATLTVVPAVVAFVHLFVPDAKRRAVALFVALFGAGLGWTLVVVKALTGSADTSWPTTIYTVEPNTFWALLSYPYLSLAHALMLAVFIGVWLAWRQQRASGYLVAAGAALALSGTHAYDLITIYGVLGGLILLTWVQTRQIPWRLAGIVVLVGVASAPTALYYQQLTSHDPLWRAILAQYSNAGVWTPPPYQLPLLMGVPLLMAVVSLFTTPWSDERRFLVLWAGMSLALVYLPVVYQIKLLSGWQFPLALLTADAWYDAVRPALRPGHVRTLATSLALFLVVGTNAYLFAWRVVDLRRHSAPYYLQRDEAEALAWLASHTDADDLVLAAEDVGRFVPNYGRTRSFLAHWAMTNRYFERRDLVTRFFNPGDASPEWRATLIKDNGITFVVDGGDASETRLDDSASFELVFERPRARVFRVGGAHMAIGLGGTHP